ncbi:MAG: DUF2236 domain-containing protein [Streptosporangiales bacterium]|nr:DUF2236 domain-containing protein [Streptosporangiales bacterium]
MQDDGLFGPDSITWRVHMEPILWIGGFRALLLQALHPRTMRGTAQNSMLMDPREAMGRFERTTEFVTIRTYGTLAEVERAGRRVRKLHGKLTAYDPDTDSTFRIDEPEGLLWVHCGEIDSYVDVALRSGVLTAEEADRYVAESRRAAEVVGIPAADAPGSVAELRDYHTEMRPRIYACEEARRGLWRMINPAVPRDRLALKLAAPPLATLAFSTLPRWARRMYGFPALPTTDLSTTLTLRALRRSARLLPEMQGPEHMERARRRMREHAEAQAAAAA